MAANMAGCRDDRRRLDHSYRRRETGSLPARRGGWGRRIYPCDPCLLLAAEGELPGGLEALEEVVGLEEGAQSQGVDDAEGQERGED